LANNETSKEGKSQENGNKSSTQTPPPPFKLLEASSKNFSQNFWYMRVSL
jgi:hypothetical protein